MKKFLSAITSVVLTVVVFTISFHAPIFKLYAEEVESSSNTFEDSTLSEYHISTAQDFVDFNNSKLNFKGKKVYLDADIDMKDVNWTPKDFYGCFDGQYHTIKNYVINVEHDNYFHDSYCGLFLHNYGIIRRLNVDNFFISAISYYYGELVSDESTPHFGSICWSSGYWGTAYYYNDAVYAGGICAFNQGKIYGCTTDGNHLIKVYDRPKALFYCDPPYHKTENYYDATFKKTDHERLKAVFKQH